MPPIRFLGHTPLRLSLALREARLWRPFNLLFCSALTGIQLLKDGGFCSLELDPGAQRPVRVLRHRMPWGSGHAGPACQALNS